MFCCFFKHPALLHWFVRSFQITPRTINAVCVCLHVVWVQNRDPKWFKLHVAGWLDKYVFETKIMCVFVFVCVLFFLMDLQKHAIKGNCHGLAFPPTEVLMPQWVHWKKVVNGNRLVIWMWMVGDGGLNVVITLINSPYKWVAGVLNPYKWSYNLGSTL